MLLSTGVLIGQTEKQKKRIKKTMKKAGYESVELISAKEVLYNFQSSDLDKTLAYRFPYSKTIAINGRLYHIQEPKSKYIWIVKYKQNGLQRVRILNNNLKRIIK